MAYAAKDHATLEQLYAAAPSPSAKEMLMAGVDQLESHKASKAIEIFNALLAKNKEAASRAFTDEANYYLALAYLQNKNYTEALILMQTVSADKENPYSEKFPVDYMEKVKKLAGN